MRQQPGGTPRKQTRPEGSPMLWPAIPLARMKRQGLRVTLTDPDDHRVVVGVVPLGEAIDRWMHSMRIQPLPMVGDICPDCLRTLGPQYLAIPPGEFGLEREGRTLVCELDPVPQGGQGAQDPYRHLRVVATYTRPGKRLEVFGDVTLCVADAFL